MGITINSRILLSVAAIAAAAALIVGATFAFFSDSETSEGNVFASGSLDLKVDSEAHYAGLVCSSENIWVLEATVTSRPDLEGDSCDGTWAQTDLGPENKFFNLSDIKPGDSGEDTISLHVVDNDAWGRLVISSVDDLENGCGGAESSVDADCASNSDGELRDNLQFSIWLDEGSTSGFQGQQDEGEGDNIRQENEPILVTEGTVDSIGETHNIWEGLAVAYGLDGCIGDGTSSSDCPGLASDGRLVGSITYYFGIDWTLPDTVGNEVQTDSLGADITIDAVQHRNNPGQVF